MLVAINPFVKEPIQSRLNSIEIATLMSDYRTAYHSAHDLMTDFKEATNSKMVQITPKETIRMISLLLYLMQKLKMFQYMVDLYESFITNEDIMKNCNPFSLYYLLEISKSNS